MTGERRRSLDGTWTQLSAREHVEAVRNGRRPDGPAPDGPAPDVLPPDGPAPDETAAPDEFDDETISADEEEWIRKRVDVPTCWEREGLPKGFTGPVWYRRTFHVDPDRLERARRFALRFDAVSYFCRVRLNGEIVGTHRGMWDRFELDVTDHLSTTNELLVEVYKPGDHFPLGECLAGFIPYVTTTFGGIWQSVSLVETDDVTIEDVHVRPDLAAERVDATVSLVRHDDRDRTISLRARVEEVEDTETSASVRLDSTRRDVEVSVPVPDADPWTPDSPRCYDLRVEALADDVEARSIERFGMSEVTVEGTEILLNGEPIYPRGVLHWLAYPDLIAPTPEDARIEHEIEKTTGLGFNAIKHCLVVPPDRYFELADEMGVLLWVELPLWNPAVTDGFRERVPDEYRRILRRIRNHPSVIAYTVGCELSEEVDARLLETLYDVVKTETDSSLVRDNSGSAECYGGVEREFADFYDYHFYAETTQFENLLDHFLPDWREQKPLLFGEYCDSDTFRSVAELREQLDYPLWWAEDDPVVNPQNVRWEYDVVENESALASFSLPFDFPEVRRRSYAQSLAYRKEILERTRSRTDTSGYVVTNLQDTPISTAGMLDDLGTVKFDRERFRRFNADTVVTFERDRRRIWQHGADRPQYLERYVGRGGEPFRITLLASHFSETAEEPVLTWRIDVDDEAIDAGKLPLDCPLEPGFVGPIGTATPTLPAVETPTECTLSVELRASNGAVFGENEWVLWALPRVALSGWSFSLWDPLGSFPELPQRAPDVEVVGDPAAVEPAATDVVVTTAWDANVPDWLDAGVGVVSVLTAPDERVAEPKPFWREGIGLIHDHPVLSSLPHDGFPSVQFEGVTPDVALDPDAIASRVGSPTDPIVSRFDARDFSTNAYVLAGSDDRFIATSLRLGGGFGRQPIGVVENRLGAYILDRFVDFVRR